MGNFTNSIRRFFNKIVISVLALFGLSSSQSCANKTDLHEVKCMYGGPESFYRSIDTTDIEDEAPKDTLTKEEDAANDNAE
ncbi:MAG: hypothetical protein MJZ28_09555 [Paludibacteraceae bacterium]|nr:hypothetical protein [Paludibacteraceae bacterium]